MIAREYDPTRDCSCPPPWGDDHTPNPECIEHGNPPGRPSGANDGECVSTASCAPGDHTYSWPCVLAIYPPAQSSGVNDGE